MNVSRRWTRPGHLVPARGDRAAAAHHPPPPGVAAAYPGWPGRTSPGRAAPPNHSFQPRQCRRNTHDDGNPVLDLHPSAIADCTPRRRPSRAATWLACLSTPREVRIKRADFANSEALLSTAAARLRNTAVDRWLNRANRGDR
ncbi:hypothetical protein GCM10022255_069960 [Dactylosporangium darangshiense]|uniref:Uncharacterized protein n=1 Tax=Dactylosporangium darangshiense TaxID=579108 RepID=A0ABP8DIL3_9ACTN